MFRISLSYCLTAAFASGLAPAHARAQEITPQTTAPVTEALLYVATNKGINLYDALSTGKLTLISTTPYQTSGLMIGSNGKTFVTLGTDYIHTYAVASNGAIGKQLSQINTQLYTGSECGTTNGAVYDHSGQYVYVELNGYYDPITGGCAALQTFKLNSTRVCSPSSAARNTTATGPLPEPHCRLLRRAECTDLPPARLKMPARKN
jgi:hypothetical protein